MNAIDTNVIVYAFDRDELAKRARAIALLDKEGKQQSAMLLWQVAVELLACLRRFERQGKLTRDESDAGFLYVRGLFPLSLPTASVMDRAQAVFRNRSLSHWDSLLVAACLEAGISTLYSEDMQPGLIEGTLTIVNPFAGSP